MSFSQGNVYARSHKRRTKETTLKTFFLLLDLESLEWLRPINGTLGHR